MVETIVLAAFSIHEDRAIAYRKYTTIPGFLKGIEQVLKVLKPDYISVRVIK